jgi:DNA-binding SARP family transcriptional activator/predicted ATPase
MPAELQLIVLGRPRLYRAGQPVAELVSAKAQALLIYLAATGKPASRSALAGLLWGDMPEQTARANLRLALSKLRKTVGDYLIVNWDTLALYPNRPYHLDSAEFLARAAAPERLPPADLSAALQLYQGDFLEDFYLPGAPEFETWMLAERERLRQVAVRAWWRMANLARAQDEAEAGMEAARQVLRLEPWHEEAHQHLMTWLARAGQPTAALAQFEVCRRVLAEELALEPSPATLALAEQIKTERAGLPRVAPVAPPAVPTPKSNLPAALTPLIGRENELAQISEHLLNPECRLLTLLGPGGIGKTRLALSAAEQMSTTFPDGVVWAGFDGLVLSSMPAGPGAAWQAQTHLVTGIAQALRYTFAAPQPPRELLLDRLAGQTMLLVLDNLEALQPGARLLADLLERAPGVKLLVTSRQRLGVPGEWLFPVEGLAFAPPATLYASEHYPAVQLFVKAARRLRPNFDPVPEAAHINRLCTLVEGSPLAIELAARWVQSLSVGAIVARLEQNLDLLSAAAPSAARHDSLRTVLNDSWTSLSEGERLAFSRLALFQGGFSLAAAESVAGADFSSLASLVDKSWLRREGDTPDRYRIHELLRQFGVEQLGSQAEAAAEQHCNYFIGVLQAHEAALERPAAATARDQALQALDREAANVRAAAEWARSHVLDPAGVKRLSALLDALWPYYQHHGWYQEAIPLLEQAIRIPMLPAPRESRWLLWLAQAQYQIGRIADCEEYLSRTLAVVGQPVPKTELAWVARMLGLLVQRLWPRPDVRRDPERRTQLLTASAALVQLGPIAYQSGEALHTLVTAVWNLALAEQAGAPAELAKALAGCCISVGSVPLPGLGAQYARRAMAASTAAADPAAAAYTTELVGLYWMGMGRWTEAEAALEQAIALSSQLALQRTEIEARSILAKAYFHQGRFAEARQVHALALFASRQSGDPAGTHWSLLGLADCALRLGETAPGEIMLWLLEAQSLQMARSVAQADVIRCHGMLALAYARQGDLPRARQCAQTAAQLTSRNQLAGVWTLEGFAAVAETWLAHWEATRNSPREVAVAARRACQAMWRFARIFPVGQPRAWLYEGRRRWLLGQRARAVHAWQQGLTLAKGLNMPYEQARAHIELGRHPTTAEAGLADEHRRQARNLLASLEIHAEPEVLGMPPQATG